MSNQPRLSRRNFFRWSGLAVAGVSLAACQVSMPALPGAAPTPMPPVTNADEALSRLLAGNQRYALNKSIELDESKERRIELVTGQNPFAMIFSCVDSRVPPELVFDEGLGDLFVIRTAGHVIDSAVLGSLEFGVAELGIPLLMVMGHEKCGAVNATLEIMEGRGSAEGDINFLVEAIRPAVEASEEKEGEHLTNAIHTNVEMVVEKLKQSPILSEAVSEGRLQIVGAVYSLSSGLVEVIA